MQPVGSRASRPIGAAAITVILAAATILGAFRGSSEAASADGRNGAVYALSNGASGNSVLVFDRQSDGSLTAAGSVPTGGLGTGEILGSQNPVVLVKNRLIAVNPGSDDFTLFEARPGGLILVDREPSGGVRPISVTAHDDVVYVLNVGRDGNIAGFQIGRDGMLTPIEGSAQPLSSQFANPAQIQFTPDGKQLIVTERGTNAIVTYEVQDGVASGPVVHPSSGPAPFGFGFAGNDTLIVAEAFGAPGSGAVSSYRFSSDGNLDAVTASAPTHQLTTGWIAVMKNGRYVYTTNIASGSITGYQVVSNGSLKLLHLDGRTAETGAGSLPIDIGLSKNGRFLYVLGSESHEITGFRVGSDGSLTRVGASAERGRSGVKLSLMRRAYHWTNMGMTTWT